MLSNTTLEMRHSLVLQLSIVGYKLSECVFRVWMEISWFVSAVTDSVRVPDEWLVQIRQPQHLPLDPRCAVVLS